ncbi:hypothetical protein EON77_18340, partial [bacterium]
MTTHDLVTKTSPGPSTRAPLSTYRLQLHKDFPFAEATRVLDYLRDLGATDVYCSPVLAAEPGSTHGYNMVDPRRINPELGGREAFDAFARELAARGMGTVLDIVPNHMGIGSDENRLWMDVLENGRCSRFSHFFDIDWNPPKVGLKDRVLLPILGDPYGRVLERGEIRVERDGGAFYLRYYERKLPCEPTSITTILDAALEDPALRDPATPALTEAIEDIRSVRASLAHLPPSHDREPSKREERLLEKEVVKRRFVRIFGAAPEIRDAVDRAVARLNVPERKDADGAIPIDAAHGAVDGVADLGSRAEDADEAALDDLLLEEPLFALRRLTV